MFFSFCKRYFNKLHKTYLWKRFVLTEIGRVRIKMVDATLYCVDQTPNYLFTRCTENTFRRKLKNR